MVAPTQTLTKLSIKLKESSFKIIRALKIEEDAMSVCIRFYYRVLCYRGKSRVSRSSALASKAGCPSLKSLLRSYRPVIGQSICRR